MLSKQARDNSSTLHGISIVCFVLHTQIPTGGGLKYLYWVLSLLNADGHFIVIDPGTT